MESKLISRDTVKQDEKNDKLFVQKMMQVHWRFRNGRTT